MNGAKLTKTSREDLVEWTQAFVRFPSPQTELFETEPRVLNFVRECFVPVAEGLGLECRIDSMGNALVDVEGDPDLPGVLLLGYAMTHPAAAMRDPYEGELVVADGVEYVRGRGVCEQKGSLAAALGALYEMTRDDVRHGNITLAACTAGETGRHDAARAVLENMTHQPRYAVVVIGTSNRVSLGNLGRIDLEVDVIGKAAHSSTPWRGINAINGAVDALIALRHSKLPGDDPDFGPASLTPTSINSGPVATHTVQDRVKLVFDRRLFPGEDEDQVYKDLVTTLNGVAGHQIEVRRGPTMKAAKVSEDSSILGHIHHGASLVSLGARPTFYSRGALDAGLLNNDACEAVMWGPGDMDDWHSNEEMISVDDLEEGAKAYAGFLQSIGLPANL